MPDLLILYFWARVSDCRHPKCSNSFTFVSSSLTTLPTQAKEKDWNWKFTNFRELWLRTQASANKPSLTNEWRQRRRLMKKIKFSRFRDFPNHYAPFFPTAKQICSTMNDLLACNFRAELKFSKILNSSWLEWNSKELYSTWIISNLWAPRSLEMWCWCWNEDFKWKVFHLHRMNKTFALFSYYRNQFLQCAIWNAKDQARRGYARKLSKVSSVESYRLQQWEYLLHYWFRIRRLRGRRGWMDENRINAKLNYPQFRLASLSHLSLKRSIEFFRSSLLFFIHKHLSWSHFAKWDGKLKNVWAFFFGIMTSEFSNLSTRSAGDLRLRGNEMFYFFCLCPSRFTQAENGSLEIGFAF